MKILKSDTSKKYEFVMSSLFFSCKADTESFGETTGTGPRLVLAVPQENITQQQWPHAWSPSVGVYK